MEGEDRIVKFATTPIMSTYLVAVVVGDYDYVEDTSTDGVKVRVYTPVGKQEQGRFALHVATKVSFIVLKYVVWLSHYQCSIKFGLCRKVSKLALIEVVTAVGKDRLPDFSGNTFFVNFGDGIAISI